MTKKSKAIAELNLAIHRETSTDDCPEASCKQRFYSKLHLEAHKQRYPTHFKKQEATAK